MDNIYKEMLISTNLLFLYVYGFYDVIILEFEEN